MNLRVLTVLLIALTVSGCAHHGARVEKARSAFLLGDLQSADGHLQKLIESRGGRQEVLLADKAIVALVQGDVRSAEELMRKTRDGFEHLQQSDVGEQTLSLLTDDRKLAYAGEDYEQVLVRDFLAIANLLAGGDDALAYCLQANQKQQQIIGRGVPGVDEKAKLDYKRVALGAYLYGTIQEQSHTNYDDARRAYATVAEWAPDFHPIGNDLQRVTTASHSAQGNGVVYVLSMVGPGPYKEEVVEPVTSQAMTVASSLLSAFEDRDIPAFNAPVKVPKIMVAPSDIEHVLVASGDRTVGVTTTITDVNQLAIDQWQAKQHIVIGRAVARRIAKKAAVYKAKDELKTGNSWEGLALDAAEFLWSASESADTRCWSLLPGRIQILRCELPAGVHPLVLYPAVGDRPIGKGYECQVEVIDGRNSYVLACFPTARLAGNIVSSR